MMRAVILLALLLPGCVMVRTTTVHVRADDHFDIQPIVGEVNVTASLEAQP